MKKRLLFGFLLLATVLFASCSLFPSFITIDDQPWYRSSIKTGTTPNGSYPSSSQSNSTVSANGAKSSSATATSGTKSSNKTTASGSKSSTKTSVGGSKSSSKINLK